MQTPKITNRPRCSNAEPGTFNHECGRPAAWIGTTEAGFRSAFCDDCKRRGWERHGRTFRRIGEPL